MAVYALVAALALQGLSGVAGGFALAADPTGGLLGLPVGWLRGSPFRDYRIPGLVLLLVLGVVPLLVAYTVWARRRASWAAALLVGLALLIWLIVEVITVGYHPDPPLQLVYGLLGAVIVALSLLPSVREMPDESVPR